MNDGDALLRAALESPGDDTPRLAYADHLEENDEPDRAEFIRVQVELARLRPHADPKRGLSGDPFNGWKYETPEAFPRVRELERRERELWATGVEGKRAFEWFPEWPGTTRYLDAVSPVVFVQFRGDRQNARLDVSRGFVGRVRFMTQDWLDWGPAACLDYPVEHVRLADREPMASRRRVRGHDSSWSAPEWDEVFEWHRATAEACQTGETDYVPEELFDRLPGKDPPSHTLHPSLTVPLSVRYDDRTSADSALSVACIRYGRREEKTTHRPRSREAISG